MLGLRVMLGVSLNELNEESWNLRYGGPYCDLGLCPVTPLPTGKFISEFG